MIFFLQNILNLTELRSNNDFYKIYALKPQIQYTEYT